MGKRESDTSSGIYQSQDVEQINALSPQANMLGRQRMREIETEKAFVVKVTYNDSWKAGGPC